MNMNWTATKIAQAKRLATLGWTLTAGAVLVACGGGGGGGNTPPPIVETPPPVFAAVDVYVSHNGQGNAGKVDRMNEDLELLATFEAGNNRGMAIDLSDNLYIAGDVSGPPGSLRVINRFDGRPDATGFDGQVDREVPAVGSISLRGIAIAHRAGLIFAANFQGSSIEVFGTAAGENATPVASAVLANEPTDVAYDEPRDRLFAAMANGTVEVIDDFVAGGYATAASRTISPIGAVSLSGIAYDAAGDRLVLTDIGDPIALDDGSIMIIAEASSAAGETAPSGTIAGPATRLGNPVDVVLNGSEARVAENGNDLILAYENIFGSAGGNVAADLSVASEKPQSLALGPTSSGAGMLADITDLDDRATFTPMSIVAVSNPSGGNAAADVVRVAPALDELQASLDSGVALENIVFAQSGDAFATFDDGNDANGGIYVLNRAAVSRDGESASQSRDRIIRGANTGLVSPKGVEIDDASGLVFVADNDAATAAIRVFGAEASGEVAPLITTNLPAPPWDLDYDPAADRLYVALTDGSVAVFDAYLANGGANPADRRITPRYQTASGTALASNLHGIVHVGGAVDALIVSDIGSASLATDGKIFVIADASTADGIRDVSVQIDNGNDALAGATMLGNPVDLAFDGVDLYVAEKTANAILRFDDVLNNPGGDVAPAATFTQDSAESVAVVPDYLARTPGMF